MKCTCCKNVESSINDGKWSYCIECVKTKKIDENIPENERVEWEYCELCKNIVRMEDFIGQCDMLLACKESYSGFYHLCKDCGKTYDSNVTESKKLTSCVLCTHYLKKIKN